MELIICNWRKVAFPLLRDWYLEGASLFCLLGSFPSLLWFWVFVFACVSFGGFACQYISLVLWSLKKKKRKEVWSIQKNLRVIHGNWWHFDMRIYILIFLSFLLPWHFVTLNELHASLTYSSIWFLNFISLGFGCFLVHAWWKTESTSRISGDALRLHFEVLVLTQSFVSAASYLGHQKFAISNFILHATVTPLCKPSSSRALPCGCSGWTTLVYSSHGTYFTKWIRGLE